MDRPEDEVPGLGGVHRGAEGLLVTHLAHQDDVGVLADGVLQGLVEVHHVDADLSLVDDRLVVDEGELDRVLDRDDMHPLALVDVLEHRGDSGALARAGDAGEDDDPLLVLGQLGHDRRQAELLEVGDRVVDPPCDEAEPASGLEEVDAEPGLQVAVEDDVGEVGAPFILKDLPGPRGQDRDTSAVPSRRS